MRKQPTIFGSCQTQPAPTTTRKPAVTARRARRVQQRLSKTPCVSLAAILLRLQKVVTTLSELPVVVVATVAVENKNMLQQIGLCIRQRGRIGLGRRVLQHCHQCLRVVVVCVVLTSKTHAHHPTTQTDGGGWRKSRANVFRRRSAPHASVGCNTSQTPTMQYSPIF